MKKLFYLLAGFLSLAIGVLGIVLPVIPTTPLWLRGTKLHQFYVADYAETKTISRKRKKQIIWQTYLLMGISIWLAPILFVKIGLGCLTVFITYYLFWVILEK